MSAYGRMAAAKDLIKQGKPEYALRILVNTKRTQKPLGDVAVERIIAAFLKSGLKRTPMVEAYSFEPLEEVVLQKLRGAVSRSWPLATRLLSPGIRAVYGDQRQSIVLRQDKAGVWWLERAKPGDDYSI